MQGVQVEGTVEAVNDDKGKDDGEENKDDSGMPSVHLTAEPESQEVPIHRDSKESAKQQPIDIPSNLSGKPSELSTPSSMPDDEPSKRLEEHSSARNPPFAVHSTSASTRAVLTSSESAVKPISHATIHEHPLWASSSKGAQKAARPSLMHLTPIVVDGVKPVDNIPVQNISSTPAIEPAVTVSEKQVTAQVKEVQLGDEGLLNQDGSFILNVAKEQNEIDDTKQGKSAKEAMKVYKDDKVHADDDDHDENRDEEVVVVGEKHNSGDDREGQSSKKLATKNDKKREVKGAKKSKQNTKDADKNKKKKPIEQSQSPESLSSPARTLVLPGIIAKHRPMFSKLRSKLIQLQLEQEALKNGAVPQDFVPEEHPQTQEKKQDSEVGDETSEQPTATVPLPKKHEPLTPQQIADTEHQGANAFFGLFADNVFPDVQLAGNDEPKNLEFERQLRKQMEENRLKFIEEQGLGAGEDREAEEGPQQQQKAKKDANKKQKKKSRESESHKSDGNDDSRHHKRQLSEATDNGVSNAPYIAPITMDDILAIPKMILDEGKKPRMGGQPQAGVIDGNVVKGQVQRGKDTLATPEDIAKDQDGDAAGGKDSGTATGKGGYDEYIDVDKKQADEGVDIDKFKEQTNEDVDTDKFKKQIIKDVNIDKLEKQANEGVDVDAENIAIGQENTDDIQPPIYAEGVDGNEDDQIETMSSSNKKHREKHSNQESAAPGTVSQVSKTDKAPDQSPEQPSIPTQPKQSLQPKQSPQSETSPQPPRGIKPAVPETPKGEQPGKNATLPVAGKDGASKDAGTAGFGTVPMFGPAQLDLESGAQTVRSRFLITQLLVLVIATALLIN
ncbi:hypothetical protein BC939DRAFT_316855 [Gamsiella multidivaricata]|uniref:uncharacterized protein n=1 Tax=Gamsiella multidivaricata TaxID=101098 RepID=UPI00221ED070|nr:uncharacterized protein BC939DRAFT_316855 [Gamsiella multidivaricata]KAI7817706.1 hypothetical protein BC939DRAFT_316855 [Gamsiella multidivaricata]